MFSKFDFQFSVIFWWWVTVLLLVANMKWQFEYAAAVQWYTGREWGLKSGYVRATFHVHQSMKGHQYWLYYGLLLVLLGLTHEQSMAGRRHLLITWKASEAIILQLEAPGQTMQDWLRAPPRTPRPILGWPRWPEVGQKLPIKHCAHRTTVQVQCRPQIIRLSRHRWSRPVEPHKLQDRGIHSGYIAALWLYYEARNTFRKSSQIEFVSTEQELPFVVSNKYVP